MSNGSYSRLSGKHGSTPLHFAPRCSGVVTKLLQEKHSKLFDTVDEKGFTVLHQWAKIGDFGTIDCHFMFKIHTMQAKAFRELIYKENKNEGDNPLHIAARFNKDDNYFVAPMLNIHDFQLFDKSWKKSNFPPWKSKNKRADTPLHLALYSKHEKIALHFLYRDSTLCQICNKKGESPLFVAVATGCAQVVERILRILEEPDFSILNRNDGQTVLHMLKLCSGKVLLLHHFPFREVSH
ncbi:ankyrin repeat-containing protein At5g02620-like [Chenopodium quinoa]|uniref:ankyrin repeat-containing protein At5g02620-like n=1 Tax=Chenopodium quinoa TaxID=63459 RepID=UPI000B78E360|nr:ankyrin repeat-containing protein At5g02620-like [Chenopodium quinoa]